MTLTIRIDLPLCVLLALGLGAACGGDDDGGGGGGGGDGSGGADAATAGDADAARAGEPDAGDQQPLVLSNSPEGCGNQLPVGPLPEEYSHLVAARLTPPAYPFSVTGVRYQIESNAECTTGLAHHVELYVRTNAVPQANPVVRASFEVPAADGAPAVRMIDTSLDEPLMLAEGEHLMVAVELPGDAESGLTHCISMCGDTSSTANRNFWSNAAEAPYSWVELGDFGIPENTIIEAYGQMAP